MTVFLYAPSVDPSELGRMLADGGYSSWESVRTANELDDRTRFRPSHSASERRHDIALFIIELSSQREDWDICRQLKETYSDVPVIAISESRSPEVFQSAFAFGATDFINLPAEPYVLLARVRAALKFKHEIDQRKARERELVEASRQLADLNAVLNRLSLVDSLTTIPNRRCLDQSIDTEMKLAKRHKRPLSYFLLDVDCFKSYNDNYGHQAGDAALKKIAGILTELFKRPSDLVARYGGEEFAVVLPDTDGPGAAMLLERVHIALKETAIEHRFSSAVDYVSVSIGAITLTEPFDLDTAQVIERADKALYQAKSLGRNRSCHVLHPEAKSKAS